MVLRQGVPLLGRHPKPPLSFDWVLRNAFPDKVEDPERQLGRLMPLCCGQTQPSGRLNRVSRERTIGIGIHAGECELRRRVSLRRPGFKR